MGPKTELRALDLFSGCGGMTLGLRMAGFNVIGAVDVDRLAMETYRVNHPEVQTWRRDIQSLSGPELRRKLKLRKGELDLLAGCPPCQGFSSLRTRNGNRASDDRRNDLIYDFLRFAKDLRPRVVMMENVPGLERDSRLLDLQGALVKMGYDVSINVLNAAQFAVPQRRRRLILMASRVGQLSAPRPARVSRTVRDAIGNLPRPGRSGDPCHDLAERRAPHVERLIRSIPRNGGSRKDLGKTKQLDCHKNIDGFHDVYGRMAWDQVAPTITGGCVNPSKGRFLHPTQHRAITLREAALLQTFPRNYDFSLREGKFAAAQMIGNALPPEFIRRHALVVVRLLQSRS